MQSVDLTNDLLNKKPYIFPKKPNKKNVFTIGEMYCGPGGLGLCLQGKN